MLLKSRCKSEIPGQTKLYNYLTSNSDNHLSSLALMPQWHPRAFARLPFLGLTDTSGEHGLLYTFRGPNLSEILFSQTWMLRHRVHKSEHKASSFTVVYFDFLSFSCLNLSPEFQSLIVWGQLTQKVFFQNS